MKHKIISVLCTAVVCIASFSACGESSFNPVDGSVIQTGYALGDGTPVLNSFETIVRNSDGTTITDERQSKDHADCVLSFQSESELMTAVGQRFDVIGFLSARTPLGENVQRIDVNKVSPTPENIMNGTYALARPLFFIYQSQDALSPLSKNFLHFIGSEEVQNLALSEGYAAVGEAKEYKPYCGTEQRITVSATAFSYELASKVAGRYEELNAGVRVEVQRADAAEAAEREMESGKADFAAVDGDYTGNKQFGAAKYAEEGICVIVKKESKCRNVTFEQLYRLYMEGLPIESIA